MAVTLKEVAREANVSYQTVWRAIHDVPGILPSTRDRVRLLAEQLGYRPNRIAGTLRTKRSTMIGVVVFDVSNSYAAQIISGIEKCAAARGHSVLLMSSGDDFQRERNAILSLLDRGVDGLIVSSSAEGDHRYLRTELPKGFPLVAINHAIPGVPAVTIAARNREAGADAGAYLIKAGHRGIAGLFSNLANSSARDRYEGLLQAMRKAKVPVNRDWLRSGPNTIEFARDAVREIFQGADVPTALFSSTHQLTEGALLGLQDIGLRHGHGVTVVGFDIRYASLLNPPLPVLLQPAQQIGEIAADALIDLVSGKPGLTSKALPVEFRVDS
jgi:LacI family transcriptional regulator, galactose operon repressor